MKLLYSTNDRYRKELRSNQPYMYIFCCLFVYYLRICNYYVTLIDIYRRIFNCSFVLKSVVLVFTANAIYLLFHLKSVFITGDGHVK